MLISESSRTNRINIIRIWNNTSVGSDDTESINLYNVYITSNLELLYTFSGFSDDLTTEERGIFDYVSTDYIQDNPGLQIYNSGEYYPFDDKNKANSYVGVYYDERTF